MAVLVTVEAFAIALLGLLVAGLLRSHAEILRSLHNLGAGLDLDADAGAGAGAPGQDTALREPSSNKGFDLVGVTPGGDATAIGVLGADQGTLLAFLTSGCLTCHAFWDAFAGDVAVPGDARLVVVTKGPDEESPSKVGRLASSDVAVVMSTQAWRDYEIPVAPYFIYVDGRSGTVVGEGAGATWAKVSSLFAESLADAGLASGNKTAERARRRRRARAHEAARERRAEESLLAAGIHPGHPSLYPGQSPPADQAEG